MRQIILDTNFILTCLNQKIDFFEEIPLMGISILVPEKVITELERLKKGLALRLLEKEKNKFKRIFIAGKNTDNAIIKYARENPKLIVATLDRGIQRKVKNQKMIIRNKKKLEIM